MEEEIEPRKLFVLQVKSPSLLTYSKQTCTFVGHGRKVYDMVFWEIASNGR